MIDPTASVGKDVSLAPSVIIGAGAHIGDGADLRHGVVVYPDTRVGTGCTVYEHAVLGRPPQGTSAMTRQVSNQLPPLTIGDWCVVGASVVLYRGTTIGEHTLIGDLASVREQCQIGHHCIIGRGVTVNYSTSIGSHVKVMDNSHLTGNMVIEDRVFVSCLVATTNDNTLDRAPAPLEGYQGPVIREGASIGAMASLLPGIEIGRYAIVSSGAVVARPVPPGKVVAGAPARVVRSVRPEWLPQAERDPSGGDGNESR